MDIDFFKHIAIFSLSHQEKREAGEEKIFLMQEVISHQASKYLVVEFFSLFLPQTDQVFGGAMFFFPSKILIKNEARSENFLVYSKLNSVLPEKKEWIKENLFFQKKLLEWI